MQKTKLLLNILALFLCILPAVSMAQGGGNVTVSGIVTSADDKQPLIGVNVISGATSGVSTLAEGTYRITVSAGTTLTFQYIGYNPFEFTVPAGRSSVTCDVALQGDSQTLDDVVVIAYGVRKRAPSQARYRPSRPRRSRTPRRRPSIRPFRVRFRV